MCRRVFIVFIVWVNLDENKKYYAFEKNFDECFLNNFLWIENHQSLQKCFSLHPNVNLVDNLNMNGCECWVRKFFSRFRENINCQMSDGKVWCAQVPLIMSAFFLRCKRCNIQLVVLHWIHQQSAGGLGIFSILFPTSHQRELSMLSGVASKFVSRFQSILTRRKSLIFCAWIWII